MVVESLAEGIGMLEREIVKWQRENEIESGFNIVFFFFSNWISFQLLWNCIRAN